MQIVSFQPPVRKLMGPGPSDVHPRVSLAMSRPTIGHLDPKFVGMMDEAKTMLQKLFQTDNKLTIAVSAPGSAGMEMCFVNLIEPGDKVIVCQNGVFGGRMKENVERCGGEAILVEDEWGKPVSLEKLESALSSHKDVKAVGFVHAETSTGVESDAKSIAELARKYDCLTIADTVTSLAGIPVLVDEWRLDAVYSGSQKCLSCTPGLSPVTFSDKAVESIRARKYKVQSWFLDLNLVMGYWGGEAKRSYHHTAPINALYGLHEALVLLHEEGLENSWKRHRFHHEALACGLQAMGLDFLVEQSARLPQLNAVVIPQGVDEALVRKKLLDDYDLEIGAGLGALAGKVWRIGLMGYSARKENVTYCLASLESVLSSLGAKIEEGKALKAAAMFYENR